MATLISFLFFLLVAAVVAFRALKVIPTSQRAVVFRPGRFVRVAGPGMLLTIPVVDQIKLVDLAASIPGWEAISPQDLNEKVRSLVLETHSRP